MDPVSMLMAGTAIAGIVTQLFGSSQATDISKQIYGKDQEIAQVQVQENYQQYLAALYKGQRQEMENMRNQQKAAAMATAAGVNQGAGTAKYSSGLAGGLGSVSDQGAWNTLGISLGLQTTGSLFNLSNQQALLQAQKSGLESNLATAQGTMQLGAGITAAAGPVGKFAGSFVPQGLPYNVPTLY